MTAVEQQLKTLAGMGIGADDVFELDLAAEDVEIYEVLVRRFARMAGVVIDEDAVRCIPGHGLELELAYPRDDGTRRWHVAVGNGRLDVQVIARVIEDLEPADKSRRFVGWQHGSQVLMVCVGADALAQLDALPEAQQFRLWAASDQR